MFDLVFATEIPSSRYRSIGENQSVELKKKRNGSIRIKEVKSEMKKVNEEYNKTLRSFVRAKNSLDKTNQRAHQLRVDFMKSYGSKKLHIQEKMLQNYRKQQEEEFQNQNNKRIKAMRLTNQLGLMYTRNQHQLLQSKIREKNKKQQQHFKNQLKLRKSQWMDEAKQKYLEVKKGEVELFIRKNNHTSMISSRAHHNYLSKVQRQVQMLESYNSLMNKVNVLNTTLPVMQTSSQNQNLSKTFVTTTKNTFFQTQ